MADAAAEDDEDIINVLDRSASGLFLNAIAKFQHAIVRFELNDDLQIQWIREAVGSMDPNLLAGLHARLENGFLTHLQQQIAKSDLSLQDAHDFAMQWFYEVAKAHNATT